MTLAKSDQDIGQRPSLQLIRTAAPLYHDVMMALERAIREQHWKPGEQIPTESELEQTLGVSRGTVRTAVSELVRKGMLHRQAGRGTFVLGPRFKRLMRFYSYEHPTRDERIVPKNEILSQMAVVDDVASRALGAPPKTRLRCIRRLRCSDSLPFLIGESYFQTETWQLIREADFLAPSLYEVFKNQFGLYIVSADEYLTAGVALPIEAKLLGLATGDVVIRMERIAYTFESRPIEFRRSVGRSDRFRYHVYLE